MRACVRVVCMWMDGAVNLYGYIGVDLRSRGSEIKETWSHTCRERDRGRGGERWMAGEKGGGWVHTYNTERERGGRTSMIKSGDFDATCHQRNQAAGVRLKKHAIGEGSVYLSIHSVCIFSSTKRGLLLLYILEYTILLYIVEEKEAVVAVSSTYL